MDTRANGTAVKVSSVMAARSAIAGHSRGIDRADEGLLLQAYHSDADVDYGFYRGPAAGFAPLICGAQRQAPVSLHRSSTPWVAVNGDSAVAETAVIACADDPSEGGGVQRLVFGRYLDRLECRDDRWAIAHRTYVMDGNLNRPGAAAWLAPMPALANAVPVGGHGDRDTGTGLLTLAHARLTPTGDTPMSDPQSPALDTALAKLEIHDLLMAYARGVDRADAGLLASIFLPDAAVISGVFNGPGAEFASVIAEYVTANLDRCFHSIANEWVEVSGERAIGEAYVIATMTAGGNDTISGGRYIDEFQRVDGVWKIASHTYVADWNMTLPSTYSEDGMYATLLTRGCFGSGDPVYAHWRAAR